MSELDEFLSTIVSFGDSSSLTAGLNQCITYTTTSNNGITYSPYMLS